MRRVVTLMSAQVSIFELGVPCEVFGIERPEIPTWDYEHVVCADVAFGDAGQGGLRLQAGCGLDSLADAHTLIIPAWRRDVPGPPNVLQALRTAHLAGTRIVSVCTGAFLLAEAGLLHGRRATTHWMHSAELAARHPSVTVDARVLWTQDGNVFTSAGTAAGIDLCLHLVRLDLGAEAANQVARRMVVPPHRDGGQAQYIDAPMPACADSDPLAGVITWAIEHLDEPLSVDILAERAAMSSRTLARRFVELTGTTPHQWVLSQRIELARRLLETTDEPVERIASLAGFGSAANLRAHFTRTVQASPQAYRRTFQVDRAS
ncbi:helix-turn-helix domain-containing protein [soil metagenome]